jgi:sec-independent protein translocase protein TatA
MGFDFETLLILAVLAFILFGPEKLPQYAAKLGYYMAKLREATTELTQQAQDTFNNPVQPPPAQPGAIGSPPGPAIAAPSGAYEHACPLCNKLVSVDFLFCPNCGYRLKDEAAPQKPSSESLVP